MRRTFLPARTGRPRSGGGQYIITLPKLERPLWRGDSSGLCSRKEGKSTAIEKAFGAVLRAWFLGALLGSDDVERGPGLFQFFTATARADRFTPCWARLHTLKCGSSRKKISDLQPHCNFMEKRSLMKEEILHGGGGLKGTRRCRRWGFHEDPNTS